MCMSAIIWDNIKKVYYGNTKEDIDKIGFRDSYIYKCIARLEQDPNADTELKLKCIDRDETIKEFNKFIEKSDKIIY